MTVKKLKKVLTDAKKLGIIITSFKNGLFHATNGDVYSKRELLTTVYDSEALPDNHFLKDWSK